MSPERRPEGDIVSLSNSAETATPFASGRAPSRRRKGTRPNIRQDRSKQTRQESRHEEGLDLAKSTRVSSGGSAQETARRSWPDIDSMGVQAGSQEDFGIASYAPATDNGSTNGSICPPRVEDHHLSSYHGITTQLSAENEVTLQWWFNNPEEPWSHLVIQQGNACPERIQEDIHAIDDQWLLEVYNSTVEERST